MSRTRTKPASKLVDEGAARTVQRRRSPSHYRGKLKFTTLLSATLYAFDLITRNRVMLPRQMLSFSTKNWEQE
jgi:hypothetical protein